MKKTNFAILAAIGASAWQANAAITLYSHTFDGTANDSSPAVQGFTNGAGGAALPDLPTGAISYSGSQGGGFNTNASIDLSAFDEFTVEFVVEGNASGIANAGLNGGFFGITSSPTSNNTNGSALFNNAGNADGPSIGLQVGPGRSAPSNTATTDYVFDMVNGNGSFTDIPTGFVDDATDGYSIFVRYADTGTGSTSVTITSTGLDTDLNFTTTQAIAYSSFSDAVTPNVSAQGGSIDLVSMSITTIPEPSAAALGGIALLTLLRRRRH